MLLDGFAKSQLRHVVTADGGYRAFVPPPLPPGVTLDLDLVGRLSAADRSVGELAGVGSGLPNQRLLSGALLRREAVLSSRIEGTQASLSDLALFEAAGQDQDLSLIHISEPTRLGMISYAVFCLKKK